MATSLTSTHYDIWRRAVNVALAEAAAEPAKAGEASPHYLAEDSVAVTAARIVEERAASVRQRDITCHS